MELIPWNRCLGSLNICKFGHWGAVKTTLTDIRPPRIQGWQNPFLGSLNVYKYGLCTSPQRAELQSRQKARLSLQSSELREKKTIFWSNLIFSLLLSSWGPDQFIKIEKRRIATSRESNTIRGLIKISLVDTLCPGAAIETLVYSVNAK